MNDQIQFRLLFSKLWMALSNGSEPKNKADVYYEKLQHYSLELIRDVFNSAMGEFDRFPTLGQLQQKCQSRLNPGGNAPDEDVRYEPTNMLCPKCGQANLERIHCASVPDGGQYLSCTNVSCNYSIVQLDGFVQTLRVDKGQEDSFTKLKDIDTAP